MWMRIAVVGALVVAATTSPALIAVPRCDSSLAAPQQIVAGLETRLRTVCTSSLPRVLLVEAARGVAEIDARGLIDYTPDAASRGLDTITVTLPVADGPSSYSTGFAVEIVSAAVAVDDTIEVRAATSISMPSRSGARETAGGSDGRDGGTLLANDVVPGPGWLVQLGTTPPAHGTLDVDPRTGEIDYRPDPGFAGSDTVLYRLSGPDPGAHSNVARLTLIVR